MATTHKIIDEDLRQRELRNIEAHSDQIADFCRRNGILRLSLFGSILRPHDFGPESDIDVLVEVGPEVHMGFSFFGLEIELEEMLGRRLQLLTAEDLSPYFRSEVVQHARLLYDVYTNALSH